MEWPHVLVFSPSLNQLLSQLLSRQVRFNFNEPMRMTKELLNSEYDQMLLIVHRPIQRLQLQELLRMTIEDYGKEQKPSSSQAKVIGGHPWPRSPFLTNMPDQRELSSPSMVIGEQHEIRLSEEEAYDLAAHLKQRLQDGTPLDADPDSIAKMVAGLGDPRVFYAFVFADSLGNVGSAAVPALCQAMRSSNQVTVRRAAAKTLTLIADEQSIPDLLNSLLTDPDSVVQGPPWVR